MTRVGPESRASHTKGTPSRGNSRHKGPEAGESLKTKVVCGAEPEELRVQEMSLEGQWSQATAGPRRCAKCTGRLLEGRQRQLEDACGHRPTGLLGAWDGVGQGRQSAKD